jgi:aromatic ring-cleaving dioxygenase
MTTIKLAPRFVAVAACLLCAAAVGRLSAAETIEPQASNIRQPFAPAFVVNGAPRERGIAYGKQFKEGIRQFLQQEIYDALGGKLVSKEEMLKYAAACGKETREFCPLVAEEIEGIAEGAGLSFDEIILIHAHEELYHRSKLPEAKHGHCTAVAVSPTDAGDGHTYVGQTWDWMTRLAGVSSVTEWRRDDAPSVLAYGYPGMPMGAGVNSEGIALCWTSGGLALSGKASPRVGVPSYALITHLLAQKDIESVIREAQRDKHAGWFTFVMADGNGNLVNIEGSPQGVEIERSSSHIGRVDYGIPKMIVAKPGKPRTMHARCVQMNKLLDQTAGKNDRKMLERYFTEREHGILAWKSQSNKSIDVMIFDTTGRKAYMTRGPEYGLEWREFAFHDAKK